jgi:hypothetical protein
VTPAVLQQGVDLWFAENTSFTYGPLTVNNPAGHYTQVVWATTLSIGCGATVCASLGGAAFLVCDYSPLGNFIGLVPYTSGTACTQCPMGLGSCSAGLCSAVAAPAAPAGALLVLAIALLFAGLGFVRSRSGRAQGHVY